jgi:hypothetical protein
MQVKVECRACPIKTYKVKNIFLILCSQFVANLRRMAVIAPQGWKSRSQANRRCETQPTTESRLGDTMSMLYNARRPNGLRRAARVR